MLPKNMKLPKIKPAERPLWKGPKEDGITFSLLSRFLACRERFRLLVVEGIKPSEGWNHRIGYGTMWHLCEESLAAGGVGCVDDRSVFDLLDHHVDQETRRYPFDREKIEHWQHVCKLQFPLYVQFWSKHPDVVNRTPIMSEVCFKVPYCLPSGRAVTLRGKWDSVDLVEDRGRRSGVWLQENKTKGEIEPEVIARQLTFDLQTMLYLVALTEHKARLDARDGLFRVDSSIRGVRYNVIRRPLSGGKGTIVRHKATKNKKEESKADFYRRVGQYIKDDPGYFFMRWQCEVTPRDIEIFCRQCLDPVLEQLCDWWEWVSTRGWGLEDPWSTDYCQEFADGSVCPYHLHFRFPYGVWNPMMEGRPSDLDEHLASGSMTGLTRTNNLFPELGEDGP